MSNHPKFVDFNFKLAVIQVLMYEQAILTPPFDVYEFAKNYSSRQINIDEEGYEIIPEVKEYFEQLEIPTEALLNVEEICQYGSNEIYLQLCPFWDGEDDIFDIYSTDDIKLLPNLKAVALFYTDDEKLLEQFREKGITAEWI